MTSEYNQLVIVTTIYLPSSSIINTVASPGSSTSKEDELMLRIKLSFSSNISSLVINTLNEALVNPEENVTLYGTEP